MQIKFYFHDVADIYVGYEFSLYTTTEGMGQVQICAVLMDPGPATAPREFVLSSTTESGTASMSYTFPAYYVVWNVQLPLGTLKYIHSCS